MSLLLSIVLAAQVPPTADVVPAPLPTESVQAVSTRIEIPDNASGPSLIEAAKADLQAQRWHAAASRLQAARGRMHAPPAVLAYDEGLAWSQANQWAKAGEAFASAMAQAPPGRLKADAAYNLGNVTHHMGAQALSGPGEAAQLQADAQQALMQALQLYRDAIAANPDDADARANAQLTWERVQEMQQQQQQDQEQDQDQQQQDQDQQQQDQEQDQDQQAQDQDPQQQDQHQDQQQQDQRQDQQQNQRQDQQQDQQQQSQEQSQQSGQPVESKPLTREEAQRLLQRVRDRQQAQAREAVEHTPGTPSTGKDW